MIFSAFIQRVILRAMFEHYSQHNKASSWLALVIGNTRLHWGYFYQDRFALAWHTPHLTQSSVHLLQQAGFQPATWQIVADSSATFSVTDRKALPQEAISPSELWVASAVPEQLALWLKPATLEQSHKQPSVHLVERSRLPLTNVYPTLGVDRAVNLLGAGQVSGWPTVVIDSGTALTFTAGVEAEGKPKIYGGAILPGLQLQRESLAQKTAVLRAHIPTQEQAESMLPARWATDTEGAITSGLIYSITAAVADYLTDWWQQFPEGKTIITGGDAALLHQYLQQRTPALAARVLVESNLMFYGMQVYRKALELP